MRDFQVFASNYSQRAMQTYTRLENWLADREGNLVLAQCATEEEVIDRAGEAEIFLALRSPTYRVTNKVISSLPRLRLVMASGNGYDHIDVQAATDHGVVVTNSAMHDVEDVAEYAMTLVMACGRNLLFFDRAVRQGRVGQRPDQPVHRLVGQTVGLIGFGNIGRAVAWRARGLGFQVLAHDPYVQPDGIRELDAEPVGLDELLSRSDFVSLHLRLTDETRHLLGEKQLKRMKPTAYLVNTSRGGVVDEAALIRGLKDGWIAGAGLDVFEQEPPDPQNPLLAMDNVIVSPHAAAGTVEARGDWINEWLEILGAFLEGRWPINVVNPGVRPKVPLRNGG